MANGWELLSLREAGVSLLDCEHRTPPAADSGYPYIAIPQIRKGRIDLADVRRISHEHFVDWTRKTKPQPWDVILSRRCNPGETALVPAGLECALGQNLVLLRANGKRVMPAFLRWLARSPAWWEQVQTLINVGAVFDSLKCADIPNFRLPIPPIPEQKAIAHILGTLDDKIELNRRMNETLEAMARAIFKSWFVDFDSVRAKAEGRPTALPKPIADLFPDSLKNSELGTIPSGWQVQTIGDAAAAINARSIRNDYPHEVIKYVDISSVTVGRLLTTTEYQIDSAPSRAQRLVAHGDTIWSCVRPNRKSFLFIHHPDETMVVSTGFAVLTPKLVPPCYLYAWVTTDDFVDYLSYNADGSAYPAVRPDRFAAASILLPSQPVLDQFEAIVDRLRDRIATNERESLALAETRDALLPRLLSGELDVSRARQSMKEAI